MRISPLRLRLRLHSASLLAVLAGYCLLLFLHQGLASFERRQAHQYLLELVVTELLQLATTKAELRRLLLARSRGSFPQLRLKEAPPGTAPPDPHPSLLSDGSQSWLVCQVAIPLQEGGSFLLQVEQNVTDSLQQERLGFWFLVVAAGLASLFTSVLLRLVFKRGLTRPLENFSAKLRAIEAPPLPGEALAVAEQPEELRSIAEAFNALQQRLAASWERQRSFVDGVAHELRTPITLVSGHAQRLLREAHDPSLTPSLTLIQQEAARMGTLVADLLDLARQDAGRLCLRRQPIHSDDVLLALYERLALSAEGRLQLAVSSAEPEGVPEGAPPLGWGDPDRLQQCLTALVDNAMRYSPPPEPVTVGAARAADGDLLFWVRDHGPGVAADERELIFVRFMRGSAALNSDRRGSGIGLAVVKLLMEAMGGRVQVVEAPGGGAEFRLYLSAVSSVVLPPSA